MRRFANGMGFFRDLNAYVPLAENDAVGYVEPDLALYLNRAFYWADEVIHLPDSQ